MGLFSGIGSFLNDFTGISSQQNKTYKQQVSSMEAQNAYNRAMWNAQNEYNSPSAQLARMREAGIDINPTSYALGTGNLSNTATFVGSENGFSGSGSPAGNPISMAMGVANGIAEYKLRDANADFIDTQNQNLKNYIYGTGKSTYDPVIQKNTGYVVDKINKLGKKIGNVVGNVVGDVNSFVGRYMPSRVFDRQKVRKFVKEQQLAHDLKKYK